MRAFAAMLSGPPHSFAARNSVLPSPPPSMQAKQPRSSAIVCSTSPPSRTRTQRRLGTSRTRRRPPRRGRCRRGSRRERGPHSPVRQAAVGGDGEGRQPVAVRLGEDQGRVVGRDGHAVGKGDAVRDLPRRAVRGDQGDDAGGELAGGKVEADGVDVGVAPAVDDDLVPGIVRKSAQVGMGDQRPVALPAQESPLARRNDQQATVGQPVDAEGERRHVEDDLALAREVDGDDLLRASVGKPEAVLVPAGRLGEGETDQQGLRFGHGRFLCRRGLPSAALVHNQTTGWGIVPVVGALLAAPLHLHPTLAGPCPRRSSGAALGAKPADCTRTEACRTRHVTGR